MQKNLESYNDTVDDSSSERQGISEDFDVNLKTEVMNDKTVVLDCTSRISVYIREKHLTVDGSNSAKNKFSHDSHSTGVHHEDFVNFGTPPHPRGFPIGRERDAFQFLLRQDLTSRC